MPKTAEQRRFLSAEQLVERWALTGLDPATQNRFLRNLREKRRIDFVKLTSNRIVYPLSSIERIEKAGWVPARHEWDLDGTRPTRRSRKKRKAKE